MLDPDIRTFVERMSAAYAAHPPLETLAYPEQRRVVEEVRRPWRQGGPEIAEVFERTLDTDAGPVRVRVYDPEPGVTKGALVYLHGGGWTFFSLDTHDRLMREYAGRGGFTVIGVDYPLSPEAKFPRALNEVVATIRWLRAHGGALHVDPGRLALGGDSAGGNIGMATALTLRDAGERDALKAVLLNYGAFAHDCSPEAAAAFGREGFILDHEEMRVFWANYLAAPDQARDPLACPILAPDVRGLPPMFFAIPACDILSEQSFAMAERLKREGVEVTSQVYGGATHSFLEAVSISPLAARALQDGADWLKRRLVSG
jgi:acetyl esterase